MVYPGRSNSVSGGGQAAAMAVVGAKGTFAGPGGAGGGNTSYRGRGREIHCEEVTHQFSQP